MLIVGMQLAVWLFTGKVGLWYERHKVAANEVDLL